jgi:hypothetical protein
MSCREHDVLGVSSSAEKGANLVARPGPGDARAHFVDHPRAL